MKIILISLTLVLMGLSSSYAQSSQSRQFDRGIPDFLVTTVLDQKGTHTLTQLTQNFLKNFDLGSIFKVKIHDRMLVEKVDLLSFISDQRIVNVFEQLAKDTKNQVRLLDTQAIVDLKGFSYTVDQISPDLQTVLQRDGNLTVFGNFGFKGLKLSTDELKFDLNLPLATQLDVILHDIEIIFPEDQEINFEAAISVIQQAKYDKQGKLLPGEQELAFSLLNDENKKFTNFEKISNYIDQNKSKISIRVGNISINEPNGYSIFLGNNFRKLDSFNNERVKDLLLREFTYLIEQGLLYDLLTNIELLKVDKSHWIDADEIFFNIALDSFHNIKADTISFAFKGDFCAANIFELTNVIGNGNCLDQENHRYISKSTISPAQTQESISYLHDQLIKEQGNLAFSLSEDFINKLLISLYETGTLDDQFHDENGRVARLGPERLQVKLDKQGDTASIYLDLIISDRMIPFRNDKGDIRFPVIADVSFYFEYRPIMRTINGAYRRTRDWTTHLMLDIKNVRYDKETIFNGIPELNLPSNFKDLNFVTRHLVYKELVKLIDEIKLSPIDIEFPELENLGLESLKFTSDGNGRLNAIMNLRASELSSELTGGSVAK